MTFNVFALRAQIVEAAVTAVNGTARNVELIAKDKAPVRKVFKGGRQTVRFKTASEIEADRGLRAKLGLAPEILATPEAIARVRAGRINPKGSTRIGGEEFGFARTVEHAGRIRMRPARRAGLTEHGDAIMRTQGRPRNLANRPNKALEPRRMGRRQGRLFDAEAEDRLSARGRYELRTERAVYRALQGTEAEINKRTGEIVKIHYERAGIPRLGGALRDSIHVEEATASQFPVIKASVVAGGEDAPYAKFQELGTRHNPAHPFLRPALAVGKKELPGALRRALARILGGSRR